MKVDTLKVFVTVAELEHFSRAAEALNISQPGVSQHIRNLEAEFDTKLLQRSPKQVRLTQAGEMLYRNAKLMLSLYEEAKRDIFLLRGEVTGMLRVAASYTIGEYVLPQVLADFANIYPSVDIETMIVNTERVVDAVRSSRVDIGLIEGAVGHMDVRVKPFMEDEMVIVAPPGHPLGKIRVIDSDMLQRQTWIFRENGSGTRAYSDHLLQQLQITVNKSYVFGSNQSVKEAVAAGLGLAVLSRFTVRKELQADEITQLSIPGRSFSRQFILVERIDSTDTLAKSMFTAKLMHAGGLQDNSAGG